MADHSPEKSSLEHHLDPITLKSLYLYSTIETHTSHPQEYSGTCQEEQKALVNNQGLPSPGVPPPQALPGEALPFPYRTAMEFFCLLLFTFPITDEQILKKL